MFIFFILSWVCMMVSTALFVTTLIIYWFNGSAFTNVSGSEGILAFANSDAVRKGMMVGSP